MNLVFVDQNKGGSVADTVKLWGGRLDNLSHPTGYIVDLAV